MKKTKYFRALEVYLSYTFLLHGPPWLVALQPKSLHPCFAGDATSCHWNQRCQRRPKRTPIPESHGVFGFRMRCQFWWVVRSGLGRWDPFFDIKEQDLLANRFQTKGWDKSLRTTTMFWLISSVHRTNSCSIMPLRMFVYLCKKSLDVSLFSVIP